MVKSNILLTATTFMLCMVAGAFPSRDSKASGTPYQSQSGRTTLADSMLVALSANVALPEVQQVLHPENGPGQDVEDYKVAPEDPQILLSVDHSFATIPTDLAVHKASLDGLSLGKALELAKVKAKELDLQQVASDIELWVEHHPWKAAFYAASAIGFFAPEILSIPALEALGFGLAGVRAGTSKLLNLGDFHANGGCGRSGSLASKVQSVIGDVAARSVFAIWQSARIGGYGVEYVNGGVRALVALTDAAVAACNPLKDCKGLISDGGRRLLGDLSATTPAVVCGFLVGLHNVLGLAW